MSIDLSRVTGISDSRGVITEIKDSLGRVIWAVSGGKAVLMVEKITSNTYANETTYTDETFILLEIYPKTNGTVKVTYGGLTKTITDASGAEEPNAQEVFFGTFNGVSDSVATPASGELTIEGDYRAWGQGVTNKAKSVNLYCMCIISVKDFGIPQFIPTYAFGSLATDQPNTKITNLTIPDSVIRISGFAFLHCDALQNVTFENTSGWRVVDKDNPDGIAVSVTDTVNNAVLLNDTYSSYIWHRS